MRNVNQLHASDLTIYPLITGKLSSQFGCISPDGARVSTYLYVQESTFQLSVSIELRGADLGSLPRMCFRQPQQFEVVGAASKDALLAQNFPMLPADRIAPIVG